MDKQIAVELPEHIFDKPKLNGLMDVLVDLEKNTSVFVLDTTQQVLLSNNYTTISGVSKLTWLALRQFCNALSSGFYKVVADLCGRSFSKQSDRLVYSNIDAVSVYNMVVNRRFGQGLERKQVIKNIKTNVIETLLSQQHSRIPLCDAYASLTKILGENRRPDTDFEVVKAKLLGRKLFVQVMPTNSNKFYSFNRLGFKTGFLFTHSEYANKHISFQICISFDSFGLAVGPPIRFEKGVDDFNFRMSSMFTACCNSIKQFEGYRVVTLLENMDNLRLGFVGDFKKDKLTKSKLVKKLCRAKLKPRVAEKVITSLLMSGTANHSISSLASSSYESWPKKNHLDLFVSLLAESTNPIYDRPAQDNIEQVAFKLLSGKLKLNHE
jgi:hypothetical protein